MGTREVHAEIAQAFRLALRDSSDLLSWLFYKTVWVGMEKGRAYVPRHSTKKRLSMI